ncbi:MAG TPA: 2Fe-2S iron-sulfur cluster-binding protein [Solirubrobacteraceae bacterium]|nr:2Fe-2S iron-sulfur cluster-binding protein [Solirubrobacteraceae bacterium]
MSSTASRSAWTAPTTSACSGGCATCSASPAPSTAAGSRCARRARATSTARRSTPARCRSRTSRTRTSHTIEGLPATVGKDLHPMQEAWLDVDVAQCGYCQPGQIMAAVALVKEAKAAGRSVSDADLDGLRNVCRCGTYPRIRKAIEAAAAQM